jgi:hypothetical protein
MILQLPAEGASGCPSRFTLDRFRTHELGAAAATAVQGHLQACRSCIGALGTLEQPAPAIDLDQIWRAAERPSYLRALLSRVSWPGLGAVAAVAATVVLWVGAERLPETTSKGGPWTLSVIARLPGGEVQRIDPGGALRPGDRLRFEVSTSWSRGQVALVSLDSGGRVSPLVPAGGQTVPVAGGRRVLLEGAVELDQALGPERVLLVGCRQPLPVAAVLEAARAALATAGGDPRRVSALGLGCHEESFWINKVRP